MTVTVVSRSPAGWRCTLYAQYAEAISRHFGLSAAIQYPGSDPHEGPSPPAMLIRGQVVQPSDGVIVAPEDIVAVLVRTGLCDRIEECHAELERIQEDAIMQIGE